jgi:ABC-type Fe3+ transport system permease subunit/DNA-binding beta-propeller fold protein YncE
VSRRTDGRDWWTWSCAALALLACVSLLGLPILGAMYTIVAEAGSGGDLPDLRVPLLVRTLGVAVGIAMLAVLLGMPGAWAMRRLHGKWVALLLAPMLLPNSLVYTSWGLLRAPGTVLGDVIERADSPALWQAAAQIQAIGGLALWAWPIAAIIVGAGARRIDGETLDALRLAGGSRFRRGLVVASLLRGSIILAFGVIALIMLGSAIPLHVAGVRTYTLVIWLGFAEQASHGTLWLSALPLIVMGVLGGCLIGAVILRGALDVGTANGPDRSVGRGWVVLAAGVWCLSTLVPLGLLVWHLDDARWLWRFWSADGDAASLGGSALVAAISAGMGLLIAVTIERAQRLRRFTSVLIMAWLGAAFVPGVLIGFGTLAAGSLPGLSWLGDTAAGIVVSHVVRFGAVGALAGWWIARSESPSLRDARHLYAGGGIRPWLATVIRCNVTVLVGAGLAMFALSLHEIEATAVVAPPGPGTLAQRMLSLLHYLRDQELIAASIWLLGGGLTLGVITLLVLSSSSRTRVPVVLLALLLVGCDRQAPFGEALPAAEVIATRGLAPGQCIKPRGIASDGTALWIVDKTDRVQRIEPGKPATIAFQLPETTRGNPVGITVGPDGLVYVADTHQNRVLVLRPQSDGTATLQAEFGAYGEGPGQFIYPTDVAIVPTEDGVGVDRIYVAEYGGNDRISVFDSSYSYLFSFGQPGAGEGVEFHRPQSIAYDPSSDELIVIDATNHRVGRFNLDGTLLAWLGAGGAQRDAALGAFDYPWGMEILPGGRALIVEFGNNRVQLVDLTTGGGLGAWGIAGRDVGELASPWAVAVIGRTAYVADSLNHRVQSFRLPGRFASRW